MPVITDLDLNVARGIYDNMSALNKYGQSTNVDAAVLTDIWDRANPTDDQDIWVAPTQARIHNIVSASNDDKDAGAGCRTMIIYGLTSWSTAEVSETITMDGTADVATTNAYVIIHRMICLTWGASGPNAGNITATAVTDATVTAQILAAAGQTQMAIWGLPSGKSVFLADYYGSVLRAQNGFADLLLKHNPSPNLDSDIWITKHTCGVSSNGKTSHVQPFKPHYRFDGPGILKVQAIASANNMVMDAGFNGYVVDD